MNRKRIQKELKDIIEVEKKILFALSTGEGTEKEVKFVVEKLFEIADYIVSLENFLERTKNED